jgi:hypothetical protein
VMPDRRSLRGRSRSARIALLSTTPCSMRTDSVHSYRKGHMSSNFFVPHDLTVPVEGAASGPLAGLTVVIKDMCDIAGTRTGGGNPEWLER